MLFNKNVVRYLFGSKNEKFAFCALSSPNEQLSGPNPLTASRLGHQPGEKTSRVSVPWSFVCLPYF